MSLLAEFLADAPVNRWPAPAAGPVVVGMSGGVDSATTAWVLRELGYEVIGITAHLFGGFPGTSAREVTSCCSLPGSEDARRVAAALEIPFYVLNLESAFHQQVLAPFAASYLAGETPNPCVDCNRAVKFEVLLRKAEQLGAGWLATGHYARIIEHEGELVLARAASESKDQSYFMYFLGPSELERLGFPLGGLSKAQVRLLAAEAGLPVAQKPESQDLCFAPQADYAAALEGLAPGRQSAGPIRLASGEAIGQHAGLAHYTVGQRRGIGLAWAEPLYVLRKDAATNTLIVGPESALTCASVLLRDFSGPQTPFEASVRGRYRGPETPAWVTPLPEGRARVEYREPGPLPAPGQVAVCYDGEVVVGGGRFAPAWEQAPVRAPALP